MPIFQQYSKNSLCHSRGNSTSLNTSSTGRFQLPCTPFNCMDANPSRETILAALNVCILTQSAPPRFASRAYSFAFFRLPSKFAPISAMKYAGAPSPTLRPSILKFFEKPPRVFLVMHFELFEQCAHVPRREHVLVQMTVVLEAFGEFLGSFVFFHIMLHIMERGRQDHVPVFHFIGEPALFAGDETLVEFFPRTDTDDATRGLRRDGLRKIDDFHRRDLRHEHLAAAHDLKT